MTSYNDITGDAIKSKSGTKKYRDNYDKIFSKPKPIKIKKQTPPSSIG
tara:strand:+ start:1200 stop:1343 length:144 start_codon:yes stop_codon:yes gene_type:complete